MKKLVVLVAGLLSVALFAQAEETQNTNKCHLRITVFTYLRQFVFIL